MAGTKKFAEALKKGDADLNLIGQFGTSFSFIRNPVHLLMPVYLLIQADTSLNRIAAEKPLLLLYHGYMLLRLYYHHRWGEF